MYEVFILKSKALCADRERAINDIKINKYITRTLNYAVFWLKQPNVFIFDIPVSAQMEIRVRVNTEFKLCKTSYHTITFYAWVSAAHAAEILDFPKNRSWGLLILIDLLLLRCEMKAISAVAEEKCMCHTIMMHHISGVFESFYVSVTFFLYL